VQRQECPRSACIWPEEAILKACSGMSSYSSFQEAGDRGLLHRANRKIEGKRITGSKILVGPRVKLAFLPYKNAGCSQRLDCRRPRGLHIESVVSISDSIVHAAGARTGQ